MGNVISKKTIDVTGVELMPGEPAVCLGNGEQGFECCCDECDYFLLCFPQFDSKSKKKIKKQYPSCPTIAKQRKGTCGKIATSAFALFVYSVIGTD